MAQPATRDTYFHLHLISDATGETLHSVARAACAQFERAHAIEHIYALVRSEREMAAVMAQVEETPGMVMFTLMNPDLSRMLEERCHTLGVPCIPVLDAALAALERYLGTGVSHKPGGQHEMDASYFSRIEALNFTMTHDDGQNVDDIHQADIVLVGVSRSSKTPTCIYLANRGIRAANVPLIPSVPPPPPLEVLNGPLVVGLTASPDRLIQIRRNRLLSQKEEAHTDYVDLDAVRREVLWARKYCARRGWPVIDVTRRSVEETAAAILNLYNQPSGRT